MRITFEEVHIYASKSGKCGCGKRRTRRRKFDQTINPWNRNAAGFKKSRAEIFVELEKEVKRWRAEPITCDGCNERLAAPNVDVDVED